MKLSTYCIWSIYVLLWDLRLPKLNVFWLKHLLEDCRAEPPNSQVRKVKLHWSAPWILRCQKFISYVAQSFESIFWKFRDCFLMWNVFFGLKSCIGCDLRPSFEIWQYFARVKALKFCKYLKTHKIFQLQSIQEHGQSICVLKPF